MKVLVVLILAAVFAKFAEANALDVLRQKENELAEVAAALETMYANRCPVVQQCRSSGASTATCHVESCGTNFPAQRGFMCNFAYGNRSDLCPRQEGLTRSMSTSTVRGAIGPGADEFVCYSAGLDASIFPATVEKFIGGWVYVGHDSGAFRSYPGAADRDADGTCGAYDPRNRPWYAGAAGGPKDVVAIFERSRYVGGDSSGLMDTRCGLFTLLDSLTPQDFVTLIGYNAALTVVGQSDAVLHRATKTHVNTLKNALYQITATGSGYDDRLALDKAFEIFAASTVASGTSTGCTKILMFFTDGITQQSETNAAIARGQTRLGTAGMAAAHVFGYSIVGTSSGKYDGNLKAVTCANDGIWSLVRGNPKTEMRGYFQFLAMSLNGRRPSWTAPYIDAMGLGEMVTVSQPFFDKSKVPPMLLGVVGADIPMKSLETMTGGDRSSALGYLLEIGSSCPTNFAVSECVLQQLRSRGSYYTCPDKMSVDQCNRVQELTETACTTTVALSQMTCPAASDTGLSALCCKTGAKVMDSANPPVLDAASLSCNPSSAVGTWSISIVLLSAWVVLFAFF